MRTLSLVTVLLGTVVGTAGEAGKSVPYETGYTAYFVKNSAPIKDFPAHLVLTDKKQFDAVFGVGFTMKKRKTIDPQAFATKTAVVVIKKGNAPTTYTVQQVTATAGALRVEYQTVAGKAGSATYASPLLVLAAGRNYADVVFVENGKELVRVKVPK